MGALIGTMSQNKTLCDEFTENFNYPERQWDHIASPERIHAWLARVAPPQATVAA
jgi:hypothetical protein